MPVRAKSKAPKVEVLVAPSPEAMRILDNFKADLEELIKRHETPPVLRGTTSQ